MSNHSILYKLRRKLQVLAYRISSPEFVSQIYFRHELGYKLDLDNPKTFNEKLQWLKLYWWPQNEDAIICADKLRVREYVSRKGFENILNSIIGVWSDAKDIDWDKLPDRFALKCNHGCGYNLICKEKSQYDASKVKDTFNKWMHEDFGEYNAEPHYDRISKRIICEEFLDGEVINYNIYVFNGKVEFLSVAGGLGDGVGEHLTYYNSNLELAGFKNKNYPVHNNVLSPLLPEMFHIAEELAGEFPMVRVDLFDYKGRIILSEMTFTPGGALIPFDSYDADLRLGQKLDISRERKEVRNGLKL